MSRRHFSLVAAAVAGTLALTAVPMEASATTTDLDYRVTSPYAGVDWSWYQYKAGFHNHTTESDGANTATEMLEQAYALGFNVYSMTDHNVVNTTWDRTDTANAQSNPDYYLTTERMVEMNTGADRDGLPGMIGTGHSDEQSVKDHLNTFWTDWNNGSDATLESKLAYVDGLTAAEGALEPIMHINHPGRYYGGSNTATGGAAATDPLKVARYVGLFAAYPDTLVGMEIVNKVSDKDSYSDRILWDAVLQETMPELNVPGFANDDAHSTGALGYDYNRLLMPALTEADVHATMRSGAFYSTALVAKRELGADFKGDRTLPAPTITNIAVDDVDDTITIEGTHYDTIEWIADGQVVATGNTVDLDDIAAGADNYIRAQLRGDNGISFTNAFGLELNTTSNNGSFLSDSEAAAAALASVDRTTAEVTVIRRFGVKQGPKYFEVEIITLEDTEAVSTTIKVDAASGAIL
ncbi:CehA/McbA family metallohydrolase domain-containing protein [Tessaracoccus sp. Y1736]